MTFPETVKTTLWDIIDEMSLSLSSFVKNPNKDFLRRRKLDFQKMMRLIISMESGSLNHELLKFFEYDSSVPTGSAFYQQRSKLSASAFRYLLKEFNLKFPIEKFREKYYLIACDGSEFNIARNPNDPDTFHEPNRKSKSGFNMVHTISLYELSSKRYLDLEVQRFLHVDSLPDYLDTTVELLLTRTHSKKKHKHPEKESQYRYICKNIAFDYLDPENISDEYLLKLRIVRFEVADGIFENILTTLSEEDFTLDDIKYCYNLR